MSTTGPTSIPEVLELRASLENMSLLVVQHREVRKSCDSIVDAIGDDLASLRAENLRLQDRLDDLMTGLEFWKQHKVAAVESTTMDEMLMRWVEASETE